MGQVRTSDWLPAGGDDGPSRDTAQRADDAWPKGVTPGARRGEAALGDHVVTPTALLRRTALEHNAATLAAYCSSHGVDLAPHGKTTMSPELVALQMASGAWGITAATIRQVQVLRGFGVRRILLANQLVDPAGLRWLAGALERDPRSTFVCYVDSVPGVDLMTAALTRAGMADRVDVLVEIGSAGGRGGCRTDDQVAAVATRVRASPRLRLRGAAAFEGVFGGQPDADARVLSLLERLRDAFAELHRAALLADDRDAIVSAGGSVHLDRVVEVLAPDWATTPGVRVVLRSGCYLTHDHGIYRRRSPLDASRAPDGLRPAIEVWGRVLSQPEPGLALADVGRRDVSHDAGLPTVVAHRPAGAARPAAAGGVTVTALNDQHTYLRTPVPSPLAVGDLVGFGISHPCTTLDRWRALTVVEDDDTIAGFVHTRF